MKSPQDQLRAREPALRSDRWNRGIEVVLIMYKSQQGLSEYMILRNAALTAPFVEYTVARYGASGYIVILISGTSDS